MKRQAFSLISLLSLLLVAGSAIAQTVHVRADIPFSFAVGSQTFSAGTYDVRTIDHLTGRTLLLQARDGKQSMLVVSNATITRDPADKTKLIFNQYGDRYLLSQIWVAGETSGHQLLKTSREKELARELAQGDTHERVEILASLQ